jgi:phage terminase large subunit-like protein
VLFFPSDKKEHPGYIRAWFWCPKDTIQSRIDNGSGFYDKWRKNRLFEITADRHNKHSAIEAKIKELSGIYDLRSVSYDNWNAGDMAENLGAFGIQMVKVQQNMSGLALGTKRLVDGLADSTLCHDGNEVLHWMAGNAAGKQDDNRNVRPSKKESTDKIDGIVALVMALGQALIQPEFKSVYDNPEKKLVTL